eukprot:5468938-Pyramimonas_sp.AAC.1
MEEEQPHSSAAVDATGKDATRERGLPRKGVRRSLYKAKIMMSHVKAGIVVIASNFQVEVAALGVAASWRVHVTSACYLLGFLLLTTVFIGFYLMTWLLASVYTKGLQSTRQIPHHRGISTLYPKNENSVVWKVRGAVCRCTTIPHSASMSPVFWAQMKNITASGRRMSFAVSLIVVVLSVCLQLAFDIME